MNYIYVDEPSLLWKYPLNDPDRTMRYILVDMTHEKESRTAVKGKDQTYLIRRKEKSNIYVISRKEKSKTYDR